MKEELSFAKIVKEEITTNEFNRDINISLLSSFLKCSAHLQIKDNKERILIKSENAKVIRYIYNILKKEFKNINLTFSYRKSMRFNKSTEYIINVLNQVDELLEELKLDFLSTKIHKDLIDKDEKIRGYMIGLFLSKGSISNPQTSNYHFEFYVNSEEYAQNILKLTSKIKVYYFEFKMIKRRNNYVLYLKKSEQIGSFLAYMDAYNSSLEYEGLRLERDMSNSVNRMQNLDLYNYKKSIKNSEELIDLIKYIDKKLGIKNINNEKVRELCYLRMEHPEASYQELATFLSIKLDKNVSKSNVNHIIIRIREIGERLNYGKED